MVPQMLYIVLCTQAQTAQGDAARQYWHMRNMLYTPTWEWLLSSLDSILAKLDLKAL